MQDIKTETTKDAVVGTSDKEKNVKTVFKTLSDKKANKSKTDKPAKKVEKTSKAEKSVKNKKAEPAPVPKRKKEPFNMENALAWCFEAYDEKHEREDVLKNNKKAIRELKKLISESRGDEKKKLQNALVKAENEIAEIKEEGELSPAMWESFDELTTDEGQLSYIGYLVLNTMFDNRFELEELDAKTIKTNLKKILDSVLERFVSDLIDERIAEEDEKAKKKSRKKKTEEPEEIDESEETEETEEIDESEETEEIEEIDDTEETEE